MLRSPLLLLALVAASLAATALPATAAAATPGVNISLIDGAGNPVVLGSGQNTAQAWRDVMASHARTLRTFVPWNGLDPAGLDRYAAFVARARAHHLAVELVVTGDAGSMATPAGYAAAIHRLAERLKGRVAGYEIWNEPDGPDFWRGGPDPAAYAKLLAKAHRAVRAADPKAAVVVGGLIANDYGFLRALYRHGAKGDFDAVAVHTDTACNTGDPTSYYREPSGRIGRYAFTGYRELHKLMLAHGDRKPIWMSELGWSTSSAPCPVAAKAGGVSPATQARFLTRAYDCLAADPYVTQGLWFDLHDYDSTLADPVGQFGLIDDAFSRKPAFAAFTRAGRAHRIACGGALDARRPTVAFSSPRDGTSYFDSVPVRVHADDNHGVKDINLYLDGRYIPLRTAIHGRRASIETVLRRAGALSFGPHRLVARARDEARNWTTVRETIVRVGGGAYRSARIGTHLAIAYGPVTHRRMAVSGRVRFGGGVHGDGEVVMRFERFVKGAWKPKNLRQRTAHRPFRYTFHFSGDGRWRVRASFRPAGPFAPVTLRTRVLRVR
jgi:hypothetical protein